MIDKPRHIKSSFLRTGLVVSAKLAEVLGRKAWAMNSSSRCSKANAPTRTVPLVGLAEDFTGMTAYMEMHALNRLLEEGDIITGASFTVDAAHRGEFLHALKGIPRVSWVAIKDSLRENFRQTTAASIGLIQMIYLVFAMVVAFGVVYNNARISLAERARELATLRVIGFSRREVGAVLVTELVMLAMMAVPWGCCWGPASPPAILRQSQHRDRASAAGSDGRQLRLRGAGGHHRLDALRAGRLAQTQPAQPGWRSEGAGMKIYSTKN